MADRKGLDRCVSSSVKESATPSANFRVHFGDLKGSRA